MKLFHCFSHPSARVLDRLIRRQYIWPNLTRDVAFYCRSCLACQTSKVSRHNKSKPLHFDIPDARFQHVHIDIVGPLLPSNGYRYSLTMSDHFTRWTEAIPIPDMTAEAVAEAEGTQFESTLLNEVLKLFGIERIHTTSYHPAANGMVER